MKIICVGVDLVKRYNGRVREHDPGKHRTNAGFNDRGHNNEGNNVDAHMPVVNPDYDPAGESRVGTRNHDLSIDPRWTYFPKSGS